MPFVEDIMTMEAVAMAVEGAKVMLAVSLLLVIVLDDMNQIINILHVLSMSRSVTLRWDGKATRYLDANSSTGQLHRTCKPTLQQSWSGTTLLS